MNSKTISVIEAKIYSEFYTNLAVAWFAGGVITPTFTKTFTLEDRVLFIISGILGAFISLKFAIYIAFF